MINASLVAQKIQDYSPVFGLWAAAAGVELADVCQEIAAAVCAGMDPLHAVPHSLGIRKVGGIWRSLDPAVLALRDDFALENFAHPEDDEGIEDQSGIARALAGGSANLAASAGIGRRRAQRRIARQAQRFDACGDLFASKGAE